MAMTRERKEQEVAALKERFENNETLIVTHNLGLTVTQMTELRNELRKEGASFKVTKNTLAKRALEGTQFAELGDMFSGPTGVAMSQDPVAAAKAVQKFAEGNKKLVIVGGALGSQIMDLKGIEQLSKLPSLDELRSKIVGVLKAPAQKVAGVVQAPASQLARVVGAYAAKGE